MALAGNGDECRYRRFSLITVNDSTPEIRKARHGLLSALITRPESPHGPGRK